VALIAAERKRQIEAEGWTPDHDAAHCDGSLAIAAAVYAIPDNRLIRKTRDDGSAGVPTMWPWDAAWWKPSPHDRVRELVKAGALIAAEIDRLQRVGSPQ
jgi:hypothetical protein